MRREVPRLGAGRLRRELLYRELGDTHRNTVVLGGVDDLGAAVRLVSGRLPTSCTPARCEVVLALPADAPATTRAPDLDNSLGVAVVGAVRLTDPLLLAGTFTPAQGAPLLLGDGVERVGAISALGTFGRTIGWVTPLDLARVRNLGVDAWVDAATATADDFARTTNDALTVTAPGDVLRAEHDRAVTNAQRFTLLGATGSVLLLGAAVVGGAALRRDHEAFTGALRRRGAAPRLLGALLAGEVVGAAVAGTAGRPRARRGRGRRRAPLAPGSPRRAPRRPPCSPRSRRPSVSPWSPRCCSRSPSRLPAARDGVAARGVWHVVEAGRPGLRRGRRGPHRPRRCRRHRRRRNQRSPAARAAGARARRRRAGAGAGSGCRPCAAGSGSCPARPSRSRLGLSAVTGRPLRPAATAALLTAAVATSVFAGAYRGDSGTRRGRPGRLCGSARRQAEDRRRPRPSLRRRAAGRTAGRPPRRPETTRCLRATATQRVQGSLGTPVPLVGVDPAVLPAVAHWADTVGAGDPTALARSLEVGALPQGDTAATGQGAADRHARRPVTVAVTATIRADDGREQAVELRRTGAGTPGAALVGDLTPLDRTGATPPAAATGRHLVALTLRLPTDEATRRVHNLGEGNLDRATPRGRFPLGAVTVGGALFGSRGGAGAGTA